MKTIEKYLLLENTYDILSRIPGEQPLFLDIETTGLSPERSHTYLVGCIEPLQRDHWHFRQWLAESPLEERELLRRVSDYVSAYSMLVHFNGDRFDLPYLQQRCEECGIEAPFLQKKSLDLYREFKKCKTLCSLPNGKQKTFEAFLGIDREDQYDGGRLIPVYHEFVKTGDSDLEHLLLIHNEEDVIGMTKLLPMFDYVDLLEGNRRLLSDAPTLLNTPQPPIFYGKGSVSAPADPTAAVSTAAYPAASDPAAASFSELLLSFPLNHCFPTRISFHTEEGWYGILSGDHLSLKIPACAGELRYYLPNPRDYYYLPAEDTVIHKSVGEYVDKAFRKQATAKNCYVKKAGTFFLLPEAIGDPVFYNDDRKTPFREWTGVSAGDRAFWEEYLSGVMKKI